MEIFFGKSHDILQDFRIFNVLIGWFSRHMTENVKKIRKKPTRVVSWKWVELKVPW